MARTLSEQVRPLLTIDRLTLPGDSSGLASLDLDIGGKAEALAVLHGCRAAQVEILQLAMASGDFEDCISVIVGHFIEVVRPSLVEVLGPPSSGQYRAGVSALAGDIRRALLTAPSSAA